MESRHAEAEPLRERSSAARKVVIFPETMCSTVFCEISLFLRGYAHARALRTELSSNLAFQTSTGGVHGSNFTVGEGCLNFHGKAGGNAQQNGQLSGQPGTFAKGLCAVELSCG